MQGVGNNVHAPFSLARAHAADHYGNQRFLQQAGILHCFDKLSDLLFQLFSIRLALPQGIEAVYQRFDALTPLFIQIKHLFPLPVDGLAGAQQRFLHLFLRAGFKQIFDNAVFQRLLCILKGIMAREDQRLKHGVQRHRTLNQFQPGHARQPDIGQKNIRHIVGHAVQCCNCIGTGGRQLKIQLFPINNPFQSFTDDRLVIYQ